MIREVSRIGLLPTNGTFGTSHHISRGLGLQHSPVRGLADNERKGTMSTTHLTDGMVLGIRSRARWRLVVLLIAVVGLLNLSLPASAHVQWETGPSGCVYYGNHSNGGFPYGRANTFAVNDTDFGGSYAKDCRAVQALLRYQDLPGTYHTVYGAKSSTISYVYGSSPSIYIYGMTRALEYGAPSWPGWTWH